MTDRQLMQQALEALQKIYIAPEHEEYIRVWWPACEDAITALRERLAQPEQEPVAWMWKDGTVTNDPDRADGTWTSLYTSPQPRQWQGLTVAQIEEAFQQSAGADEDTHIRFARAIEAKLKEKSQEQIATLTAMCETLNKLQETAVGMLKPAIAAAVQKEREACAELCERMARRTDDIRSAALEMAAENIRARGNT